MFDLDNPYPHFASLRLQSPVARLGGSSFHLVTSWDLIAEVVGRPESFSSNLTATMIWNDDATVTEYAIADMGSPVHVLATADDPHHREHRTMVMPRLVARRVRELDPFIESTCRALWADGLHADRIDWVRDVAERLPMAVVVELLGLPDHDVDALVRWAFAGTVLLDGVVTRSRLDEATSALGELATYLSEAFISAMAHPGDNVLGDVAEQVNAGAIDHDTAMMILIQLVVAGAESTMSALGTSVWLLSQHDDVHARLRADRSLVPMFVDEALRLESPFRGHFRHVVDDTTLGDVQLPAGSHLYLAWGAANRDPDRFPDPDSIRLERSDRPSHMAFGKGMHLCVGAALARLETRIGIETLLDETTGFTADPAGRRWSRSLLSRRLEALPMTVHPS